jgi:hypothetical protein
MNSTSKASSRSILSAPVIDDILASVHRKGRIRQGSPRHALTLFEIYKEDLLIYKVTLGSCTRGSLSHFQHRAKCEGVELSFFSSYRLALGELLYISALASIMAPSGHETMFRAWLALFRTVDFRFLSKNTVFLK